MRCNHFKAVLSVSNKMVEARYGWYTPQQDILSLRCIPFVFGLSQWSSTMADDMFFVVFLAEDESNSCCRCIPWKNKFLWGIGKSKKMVMMTSVLLLRCQTQTYVYLSIWMFCPNEVIDLKNIQFLNNPEQNVCNNCIVRGSCELVMGSTALEMISLLRFYGSSFFGCELALWRFQFYNSIKFADFKRTKTSW